MVYKVELPCQVGTPVCLIAKCENVITHMDYETGTTECPFESACPFESCHEWQERAFHTSVKSIFDNGNGWYFTVEGLDIEFPISDIGKRVFYEDGSS